MSTVLIIISVLTFSATSIATRGFQLKCARSERDTYLFQAMFCLVGSAAYMIRSGMQLSMTAAQYILAALFGIFFAFASLFSAFCYENGPMSLTSVIVNSSVVVPVVYSCVKLHEGITPFQLIGFILLIATFVLSVFQKKTGGEENKKAGLLWLAFVLVAFFSNGVTAVLQKEYKLSSPADEGYNFMGLAYLVAAAVLALTFVLKRKNISDGKGFRFSPLCAVLILCAGLGSFAGNAVLLKLSTQVPAALLYPFVNGGLCVTVSVFSLAFFKEKLTVSKIFAIAVGIASIIFLNL